MRRFEAINTGFWVSVRCAISLTLFCWLAGAGLTRAQSPPQTELESAPIGKVAWQPSKLDPSFSGTVRGQVVSSESKLPVPGVTVNFLHPLSITQEGRRFAVVTDDQGRFLIENLPVDRSYAVFAFHGDLATFDDPNLIQIVKLHEDGETQNILLTLKRVKVLGFQIVDRETNAPIPDAIVTIRRYLIQPLAHELMAFLPIPEILDIARTDEMGFLATAFMAGEFHLSLAKPGYREEVHRMVLHRVPEKPIVLTMDQGGVLFGKVRDPSGKPMPNVRVSLGPTKMALTDEEGAYRIPGVNLEVPQNVAFYVAGFLRKTFRDISFPMFAKEKRLDLNFEQKDIPMTSPPSSNIDQKVAESPWPKVMKIQLLDSERKPIRNAAVQYEKDWKVFNAETDENGQLIFNQDSPPHRYLNFEPYLDLKVFVESHGVGKYIVRANEFQDGEKVVALVLPPRKTLKGRMVDVHGKPIAGAEIRTHFNGGAKWHFWREQPFTTDSEGRFVIDHVGVEDLYLRIRADGFQFQQVVLKDIPEGEKVITLNRPMRFLAEVKDIEGLPVEEFKVRVLGRNDVAMKALKKPIEVIDKDGKFEVRHLELNEPFRLFISAPGFIGKAFGPFIPGHDATHERRTLVLDNTSILLMGRVVNTRGLAVGGVKVWGAFFDRKGQSISMRIDDPIDLRTENLAKFETITDDRGYFSFDGAPENLDWALYFYKDNFNLGYLDNGMRPGLKDGLLEVKLIRRGKIEVHAAGDPFQNVYQLELQSRNGSRKTLLTGGQRPPWVLDHLKPGDYLVKIFGPPAIRFEQPRLLSEKKLTLDEGETVRLTFSPEDIGQALKLAGVAFSGETPLPKAELWLFRGTNETDGRKVITDLQGHFEFDNLLPDEYRLYYFGPREMNRNLVSQHRWGKRAVVVALDKNQADLKAVFQPKILVHGVFLGEPQKQFSISLVNDSRDWYGKSYRGDFDSKGNFLMEVDAGIYDVKYQDAASFDFHMFQEGLVIPPRRDEIDLGTLNMERKNGLVLKIVGVPLDFELKNVSISLFRREKGYFQDMKKLFDVFPNVRDGLIFTGLKPGTYVLDLDNRKNEGVFKTSWSKKEVEVVSGKIREVNLDVEVLHGCMLVLEDPNLTLDVVVLRDPSTQMEILTSEFDHFNLTHRSRHLNPAPGTWALQATTKEGKTWTKTVTIPEEGAVTIWLGDD